MDFLMWYNNKDGFLTQAVMQKRIEIYHYEGIYMLELGCTILNLVIYCLQNSSKRNFDRLTEIFTVLLEKKEML